VWLNGSYRNVLGHDDRIDELHPILDAEANGQGAETAIPQIWGMATGRAGGPVARPWASSG
jgi:hypothetical protein